jgi:glycerophosphoryl diester phosphodiesterase
MPKPTHQRKPCSLRTSSLNKRSYELLALAKSRQQNVPPMKTAPFPRVCAHRGLSGLCPENTLPAFAAAVALGADEIELDVWASRDGELVVCHDDNVARTSNGKGLIGQMLWKPIFVTRVWMKLIPS